MTGRVTSGGAGLLGVNVALTGTLTQSMTTDFSGTYSFLVTAGGSFTVTPSLSGYTFSSQSQTFNTVAANQTATFTSSVGSGGDAGDPSLTQFYRRLAGNVVAAQVRERPISLNNAGQFLDEQARFYPGEPIPAGAFSVDRQTISYQGKALAVFCVKWEGDKFTKSNITANPDSCSR